MFTITPDVPAFNKPTFNIQGTNKSRGQRLYLRGINSFLNTEAELNNTLPLTDIETRIKELTQ